MTTNLLILMQFQKNDVKIWNNIFLNNISCVTAEHYFYKFLPK